MENRNRRIAGEAARYIIGDNEPTIQIHDADTFGRYDIAYLYYDKYDHSYHTVKMFVQVYSARVYVDVYECQGNQGMYVFEISGDDIIDMDTGEVLFTI